MCGASSAVMAVAALGKIKYEATQEAELQKNIYSDNGQGINEVSMRKTDENGNYIFDQNGKYVYNYGYKDCGNKQGGAFSITSTTNCNENHFQGIVNYLDYKDVDVEKYYKNADQNYEKVTDNTPKDKSQTAQSILYTYDFDVIKGAIDNGQIVIQGMTTPDDHIFVVKGYTKDGGIVVNDPYKDNNLDNNYSTNGKDAIYYMNKPGQPTSGYTLVLKK